jgi:hypothetical protein
MDIIDRGVTSMIEANKHWNIPLSSFVDHLNGKTKSKKHVLMEEEDFYCCCLDSKHAKTWTIYIITMSQV